MNIHVLVIDGVFDLGLSSVLDTFTLANDLMPMLGGAIAPFNVTLVGMTPGIRTAQGFGVPVQLKAAELPADYVVIPALGAKQPAQLLEALTRPDVRAACRWLHEAQQQRALTAAACTATFVLAESGLLQGHRATTSWWLGPAFRQRYPEVKLDDTRVLVSSSPFVTTGAALAHIDLALSIVQHKSPALATMTARYLLAEQRTSQAAFVIPDHLIHADPLVARFEAWAKSNLASGFSLVEAARSACVSPRTLARRLQAASGMSPLSFFQDIRVQHAVHQLQTTTNSLDAIAAAVGYADGVALRALLRKKLGRGVRDIRAAALLKNHP